MKKLKTAAVIILLLGTLFTFGYGALYRAKVEPVSRAQLIMGTMIEITAYSKNAEPAIKAAFDRMREIELQVGRDESSDISRINMGAGGPEISVGTDTWRMMLIAKRYWRITNCAFDVTVGPLVDLWGFGYDGVGRFPALQEIRAAMPKVGSDKLLLNPATKTVKLAKAGMSVTVGGIAKGYAVEEAVKVLQRKGVTNAIINGGSSSIKVIGSGPPDRGWRIGIEDPRRLGRFIGVIALKSGQSIGTSADDKRFFIKNGQRYSHIIDPRTGFPAAGDPRASAPISQVTIVTSSAAEADILTKALFLNDLSWSLRFVKQHKIQAILVDGRGKVTITPGLAFTPVQTAGARDE